jgi:hypothetical protein
VEGARGAGLGTGRADGEVAPLRIGLVDVPAEQRRRALALDLVNGGHVLAAIAVAAGSSPADVHLYGVDCGANALLPLVGLPHCGAIVGRDQPERVDRLLGRLLAEVSRRQQLLAEQGASSLAEQRAAAPQGARLPRMVLLLDPVDRLEASGLLPECPAIGVRAPARSTTDQSDRKILKIAGESFGSSMVDEDGAGGADSAGIGRAWSRLVIVDQARSVLDRPPSVVRTAPIG